MKIKTDWDFSLLFPTHNSLSLEEEKKTIERKVNAFAKKWKDRDDYLKKPEVLKDALDDYEKFWRATGTNGKQGYFLWLQMMLDENNPELRAKWSLFNDFYQEMTKRMQFFSLKIAKIPPSQQKKFLSSKELLQYRHFIQRLFETGKHDLSEQEEYVMNMHYSTAYEKWVQMVSAFLSRESRTLSLNAKKEEKNFSEILSLMNNNNKKNRDEAAIHFNEILEKNSDIAEQELNAVLEYKKISDQLRGFSRPDESRLLSDDMEIPVVDALIESVEKSYALSKKFYKLKAHLLGLQKLEYHERNVPYGHIEKEFSYPEGVKLVDTVLSDLDSEFGMIFRSFVEHGQIDAFAKRGKRGGAFCAYNLITQPTYLLLNYTKKLLDVTTLAHEMGHGINYEMTKKKQNALNFAHPVSVTEVASTFMEDFVLEKILENASDEERLAIKMERLNGDISTIFRQIACYTFEKELHDTYRKKGYLSKQEIGSIFQKHMRAYMGPAVIQSSGSENWWVYWSHIRTYFYVYSYASGLLISKALQKKVRENPEFIAKVKEFLSAGTSASPKEIFVNVGIDIANPDFWQEGISQVENTLKETEILAKRLGKI